MAKSGSTEQFHEAYSRDDGHEIGSDRSFGIVFTVVFGLLASFFAWRGAPSWLPESVQPNAWKICAGISGAFLLVSLVIPKILHPLNVVWMKFGALLNAIVSPIVLGLLFFVTITPIAFLMRMAGKDLLNRKFERSAKSYWIIREPPGPPPETMKNQF